MTALNTVTSYGRNAASARVRVFEWLDYLGLTANTYTYLGTPDNSVGTLMRTPLSVFAAERRLRRMGRAINGQTVLLARQASPLSNGALERRLLDAAGYGVYDFDDALYATPESAKERLWSKRKTWRSAVASADHVIAGNDHLAGHASQFAQQVTVIPSCVNLDDYQRQTRFLAEQPTAVWLGSPSTERYLQSIAEPLLLLHRELGLRLLVISAGQSSLGDLDLMTTRVDWAADTFASDLLRGDVGIMPLPDDEWTRGKCAYKLLQYGAAGLPLIGSPVGANAQVLDRSDGLAASTGAEWYAALRSLILETPAQREARGASAWQAVDASYSFGAWESTWRNVMRLGA